VTRSVHDELLVDGREVGKVGREQLDQVFRVLQSTESLAFSFRFSLSWQMIRLTHLGTRGLPDTVHRQLRQSDIHRSQSMSTDSRSNRAPARPIVPDLELLQGDFGQVGYSSDDEGRRGVRGVSLVGVGLDDDTLIDLGSMGFLVFGFEVGVELQVVLISDFYGR
jgi:hypothetical protein